MNPQYLAEGGEAVEFSEDVPMDFGIGDVDLLSGSMAAIDGPSHESATQGVPLAGGDKVYSNKLKPTPEVSDFLSKLKIKGQSYADYAKSLGRLEAKYEQKMSSPDQIERRTGEEMMRKISEAKEVLFADQEYQKAPQQPDPNQMPMMRYGGLPKAFDGINVSKIKPQPLVPNPSTLKPGITPDYLTKYIPQFSERSSKFDGILSKAGQFLPDAANLLGFLQRRNAIKNMPLTQEAYPTYRPVLQNLDFDNQNEIATIRAQADTAGRGLGFLNPNATMGARASILGQTIGGINSSFDNKRRMERFAESQNMWQANQASQFAAQQANQRFADKQQNTWSRQVEHSNNWQALAQGIIGNAEQRRLANLDIARMALIGQMDGDRGSTIRTIDTILSNPNLDPAVRKQFEEIRQQLRG